MTRVADVQRAVAQHYGITVADLIGRSHRPRHSHPRQLAMYLSKVRTRRQKTVIGRAFDRDHSTIIAGIRAVRSRLGDGTTLHRLITIRGSL